MAFTARSTSTNILTQLVFQPGHDFTVGQLVRYDNTAMAYVLSQADSAPDCAGTQIVSIVIDTANFYVTPTGYVVIPGGGFTPGIQYYLSPTTAGLLTDVMPIGLGQVNLACFVPDSTTSGTFWGGSGNVISVSDVFAWSTITTTQVLAVNQGYWVNGGSSISLQLPATAVVGSKIVIKDIGGNGFATVQRSGQFCYMGSGVTATGVTGQIISKIQGNQVTLTCQTANTVYVGNADFGIFSTV